MDTPAFEEPLIGSDGLPLRYPFVQPPAWIVFGDADVHALGCYYFLRCFVRESTGEFPSDVSTGDLVDRFGISRQQVSGKARKRGKAGLAQRLEQAGALRVHRRWKKTRACDTCGASIDVPCPPDCTETKGRTRGAPRFELARGPAEGFSHPGPISRTEWYRPAEVARRLREEGPGSELPPEARRQVMPFAQTVCWPAFHPSMDLLDLGIYLFLTAHADYQSGRLVVTLARQTIARRFDLAEDTVSASTRKMERLGVIAKTNVKTSRSGHRAGTGEAVGYVVCDAPPIGLLHPMPLHVGEWRSPEKITQRISRARSATDTPISARIPSDLRNVDNPHVVPGYPQGVVALESGGCRAPVGGLSRSGRTEGRDPSIDRGIDTSPSVGQVQDAREAAPATDGPRDTTRQQGREGGGASRAPRDPVAERIVDQLLEGTAHAEPLGDPVRDRDHLVGLAERHLSSGWSPARLWEAVSVRLFEVRRQWALATRLGDPADFAAQAPGEFGGQRLPAPPPGPRCATHPWCQQADAHGRCAECAADHQDQNNVEWVFDAASGTWRDGNGSPMEAPEAEVPADAVPPQATEEAARLLDGLLGAADDTDAEFAAPKCDDQRCNGDKSSPRYRHVPVLRADGSGFTAVPCPRCGHRRQPAA